MRARVRSDAAPRSAAMRGGIVAENSAVWRVGGVALRIASMSSAKPMSSISSASSRTSMRECVEVQRAIGGCGRARGPAWRPRSRAALQRADLLIHRRAAVDRHHAQAPTPLRVLVDRFGHLHRQLARRHQHQPADAGAVAASGRAAMRCEHRQREGGGLAGAGRRLCRAHRGPRGATGIASRWIGVGSS